MNNNEGTTWWALGLDNAKFESDVAKSNSLFRSIGNTAEKEGSRIDNIFRKICSEDSSGKRRIPTVRSCLQYNVGQ